MSLLGGGLRLIGYDDRSGPLYWNEVVLEANRINITGFKEQGGLTLSSRALAIVHLAMYDAFVGTSSLAGLMPHLPGIVPPAAHSTLGALFPSQRAFFDLKVAAALLKLPKDDPGASDAGWNGSMAPGAHRPDPDNPNQGFHAPFYGAGSNGFAITKRHKFYGLPEGPCVGDSEFATIAFASDELNGVTRDNKGTVRPKHKRRFVKGLWGMIEENGRSREYLRVHWRLMPSSRRLTIRWIRDGISAGCRWVWRYLRRVGFRR